MLCCSQSIASQGRPEGFQREIGKLFGLARRRETSAFGKAIALSENSMNIEFGQVEQYVRRRLILEHVT